MSAAKAVSDHMKDWCCGTEEGCYVSMGVISDGKKYDVPEGICFSLPCKTKKCEYEVVDLELDDFSKGKLEITKKELLEEKEEAFSDMK
jgi:malate/lactate dehydrogenase